MNISTKIRIVIIDDHSLFRSGLKSLFETESDIEVIGEADNGANGLALIRQTSPDIVLLDIGIPGISGLEVCRQITQQLATIKVIMLTMHQTPSHLRKAFSAGAQGFILKQGGIEELLLAIRAIYAGKKYICSDMAGTVMDKFAGNSESSQESEVSSDLTDREAEIVRLVCQGWDNQQIGDALYISPATVKTHRARIMHKLDIHSNTDLLKYALKTGIIELE